MGFCIPVKLAKMQDSGQNIPFHFCQKIHVPAGIGQIALPDKGGFFRVIIPGKKGQ